MKAQFFLVLILFILTAGCTAKQEVNYLSTDETDRVAAYTDNSASNIINAIAANDYDLFITDFDTKMKEALTEDQFASIVKMYGKNGEPESILLLNVEDRDQFYGANYGVTYPKAALTMLIVVSKSEPAVVSGLWFK